MQPPDPGQFLQGLSRETKIRRDAAGRWFDDDDPITHPNLVQAFDRWIDRADDGRYCLRNSIHWVYVHVDGPPIFVRSVELRADGVWLRLSDGNTERLDAGTLRVGPDGGYGCVVRGGRLPAGFDRHAAFQLAPLVAEDADGPYIEIDGLRVRPAQEVLSR